MRETPYQERQAFYRSALTALLALEARRSSQRWFGPDADARWKVLEGDLSTGDRIDLLIRDADAQGYGSVGARMVFQREGVAHDDAFGVGWQPLTQVEASELWRGTTSSAPAATAVALATAHLTAWAFDTSATPLAPMAVELRPAEKVVVAGPSAIAAVADAMLGRADLDWADQVTVIATPPAHRQLAGICAALCHVARAPAIVSASAAAGLPRANRRLIASADAEAADRSAAEQLGS